MKLFDRNILIIERARELLSGPKRFARHAWALDKNGQDIMGDNHFDEANSHKACAWCYEGAIMKVAGDMGLGENDGKACIRACDDAYAEEYKRALGRDPEYTKLMRVNDDRGREAVLGAMDRALTKLRRDLKEQNKTNC